MFWLNLLGCFCFLFVDVDNRPSWKRFVIPAFWVNNCLWFPPVDSPRHHLLSMLIYRCPWCAVHKSLCFIFSVTHSCLTAPLTAISEGCYEPPVYCCLSALSTQPPVAHCTVPQLIINWAKIIVGQNQWICLVHFFKGYDIVCFVLQ